MNLSYQKDIKENSIINQFANKRFKNKNENTEKN